MDVNSNGWYTPPKELRLPKCAAYEQIQVTVNDLEMKYGEDVYVNSSGYIRFSFKLNRKARVKIWRASDLASHANSAEQRSEHPARVLSTDSLLLASTENDHSKALS